MATTYQTRLSNMIDPEVIADMINAELENAIKFSPIARVDNTLQGQPGSSIIVPKYFYIGDAIDVAEGIAIVPSVLRTGSEEFTIKKAAKGVEITDEALLSGYGKPMGEAQRQLLMAIANKVDNDVLAAIQAIPVENYNIGDHAWDVDTIANSIDLFGDEGDESVVLFMNPLDASALRKAVADDWERYTELGDRTIIQGTYGAVLGAQVVRSNKLPRGTGYLVRAGATAIYKKRGVEVESDRDILKKTTVITADQHYGAHVYDESKIIAIQLPVIELTAVTASITAKVVTTTVQYPATIDSTYGDWTVDGLARFVPGIRDFAEEQETLPDGTYVSDVVYNAGDGDVTLTSTDKDLSGLREVYLSELFTESSRSVLSGHADKTITFKLTIAHTEDIEGKLTVYPCVSNDDFTTRNLLGKASVTIDIEAD